MSSDVGGILVELMYLAYMYGQLFKVVSCGVGWSIQVILYSLFLGLRAIWPIMQGLALAFSALPLQLLSCTCWLDEMIQIIKIVIKLYIHVFHVETYI